jgi:hypothetical protein
MSSGWREYVAFEEFTQGPPPFLNAKDKQAVCRHVFLHFLIVPVEDVDADIVVPRAVEYLSEKQIDKVEEASNPRNKTENAKAVGRLLQRQETLVPAFRIANGQNHFGIRKFLQQFAIVDAGGKVDGCIILFEEGLPIHGRAVTDEFVPCLKMAGSLRNLLHVVAAIAQQ